MNLTTNSVFSYVEIEKTIKRSNRGSVYLARDKKTNQRYIYRKFSGNGEVYRKLQKIVSANLPKIYDVSEKDEMVYVLEEYIQGDSLAFLLEGSTLTANQTKEIALQICGALEVLHEIGAVHRDIKPENIIIRGNEAILIDFDASRLIKPHNTTDTQIMGTTGYAAPEQYGFFQTDSRADIYSMGIVLNEMLTKQHPSKQLAEGGFRPIIERCIEVNVDKRYDSAAALQHALKNAVTKPDTRPAARRIVGIAAAALLICGAALLYSTKARDANPGIPEDTQAVAETTQQMPAMEVFEPVPVEIPDALWAEPANVHETHFKYDLDNDGEMESYRLGIFQQNVPEGFQHTLKDTFVAGKDDIYVRTVYPCVWRIDENGTSQMVPEFASLLTNASVTLWRVTNAECEAPDACTTGGMWPGGILIHFRLAQEGEWIYQISAELQGQQLTSVAKTIVFSSFPE